MALSQEFEARGFPKRNHHSENWDLFRSLFVEFVKKEMMMRAHVGDEIIDSALAFVKQVERACLPLTHIYAPHFRQAGWREEKQVHDFLYYLKVCEWVGTFHTTFRLRSDCLRQPGLGMDARAN